MKDFAVILAGRWCHACEGVEGIDKIVGGKEKFDSCSFIIFKIFIEVAYDDEEMSVGMVLLNLFNQVCYMLGSWVHVVKLSVSSDFSPLMHPGGIDSRCC